jgi:hypothetical protein
VKATQNERERALAKQHLYEDEIKTRKNQFQEAFEKKEDMIRREKIELAAKERESENLRASRGSFRKSHGDDLELIEYIYYPEIRRKGREYQD